jgi:hypothetical protein
MCRRFSQLDYQVSLTPILNVRLKISFSFTNFLGLSLYFQARSIEDHQIKDCDGSLYPV